MPAGPAVQQQGMVARRSRFQLQQAVGAGVGRARRPIVFLKYCRNTGVIGHQRNLAVFTAGREIFSPPFTTAQQMQIRRRTRKQLRYTFCLIV